MTGAELRAYRVTLDQFGQNEPAVMCLLEDLVVAAVRRFGIPLAGSRICVEVFARRDGGCYIYLSAADRSEQTGAVQDVMLYEFAAGAVLHAGLPADKAPVTAMPDGTDWYCGCPSQISSGSACGWGNLLHRRKLRLSFWHRPWNISNASPPEMLLPGLQAGVISPQQSRSPERIRSLEQIAAGNKLIGSCLPGNGCGLVVDAPVYLNTEFRIVPAQLSNLFRGIGQIALSAKAGFYGHNQYHIRQGQVGNHVLYRRARFDGDTSLTACLPDRFQSCPGITAAFQVKSDPVCSGFCKCRYIPQGIGNHQMHIQKQLCMPPDCGKHGDAEGNVGDKDPVHHVEVYHIDLPCAKLVQSLTQVTDICA